MNSWKTCLMSGFVAGGLIFSACAQAPAEAPAVQAKPDGKAKLKFEKTTYDFGTTSLVQTVNGTFTFENAGDSLLILSNVQAGCGCTIPQVKPANKQLQPGEKGEISFVLNLGASRGMIEKHITVKSNDPATPVLNLSIRGNVAVVFDVPMQTVFGELLAGQTTNFTVTVKRMDGKSLKLTKVESSDPNITATIMPPGDTTNTMSNVQINVKATGNPRQIFSNISYFAEGHDFAVARTMVYGQIVTEFRVMPEGILWGISDPKNWPGPYNPEQSKTRTVQMELKRAGKQFTIHSIKTDIKDLTVSYLTEQTGRVYKVVAKLEKAPEATEKGNIIVETDLEEHPTITIPVSINVFSRNTVSRPVSLR